MCVQGFSTNLEHTYIHATHAAKKIQPYTHTRPLIVLNMKRHIQSIFSNKKYTIIVYFWHVLAIVAHMCSRLRPPQQKIAFLKSVYLGFKFAAHNFVENEKTQKGVVSTKKINSTESLCILISFQDSHSRRLILCSFCCPSLRHCHWFRYL